MKERLIKRELCRGILSYIDFIEDVTTKKTSATVDDFDALIGTVVGT